MSLLGGDLTTPQRVAVWIPNAPSLPSPILSQLITSMTALVYNKLNRARLYNQLFTRVFDGVGTMQLTLPDWPVTSVLSVQQGQALVPPSVVVAPGQAQPINTSPGYGYRFAPWQGDLPGNPAVLELVGGYFYPAPQSIRVTYQAGYLVANESQIVLATPGPYTVTVSQLQGIWCRDNGVTYSNGTPLVPVKAITAAGQYIPPVDATPGVYTFGAADQGAAVFISYSFIPADLEEAAIQMVAERYSYRQRVGELSKSLGGQETVRFTRGMPGQPWSSFSSLPPEVMDLIQPYISVLPPAMGAPV